MSEIKKFGKIYEREDGQLVYEGFHVDCNENPPRDALDVLIDLVIQRLRKDTGKND
jgi:hypothetical protein